MPLAAAIVVIVFATIFVGLAVRANQRFRQETRLPMQWMTSRSKPLNDTVTWRAPRVVALSLIPALAIGTLALMTVGATTLAPRPGQEGMVLPMMIGMGGVFLAAQILHLRMIEKTLRPGGR